MEQSASYNVYLISIHALLAESDRVESGQRHLPHNFYPRSPCGERRRGGDSCYLDNIISIHALLAESDLRGWTLNINGPIFLSTLSLRRATDGLIASANFCKFLSTLSLRRATAVTTLGAGSVRDFYPRSPCGERRRTATNRRPIFFISIHALLAESD